MAVVPRKRAKGVVYGVLTSWPGGTHWELVGANRREAESVDAQRKRDVKAGTFRPGELTDAASVGAFAERWLAKRKNRSADNDRALITRHVLTVSWFAKLRIGDVRPRHVRSLIEELGKGKLAPKSVSLVMGLVSVMFRDAVIDDVITSTPYVVARGTLKRAGVKREPYEVAEAAKLMAEPVGERERVWNALAFYTGARCGELCGLRWGDWDEKPTPLGALVVERQYEGVVLKTERPRVVPVHHELARILAAWRERWSFHFLRRPQAGDPICPRVVVGRGEIEPMNKNAAYKAWLRSCRASGVRNRSVHSTRHTFITVARRNGADVDKVELVTHNPKGTIIDRYTRRSWAELCEAVSRVKFDVHPTVHRDPGSSGENGSGDSRQSSPASLVAVDSREAEWFESRLWSEETSRLRDARLTARRISLPAREALALAAESVLQLRAKPVGFLAKSRRWFLREAS